MGAVVMADKIKWGVIGSGGIAFRRTIPEGIVPARNAELAVVYDVNQKVNEEVGQKFGAIAAGSVGEVLASEIDAVYIATPAHLHRDQVLECTRARRHVLCEKPLGMTGAEAEEMVSACRQAGIQFPDRPLELGVGSVEHSAPGLVVPGGSGRAGQRK